MKIIFSWNHLLIISAFALIIYLLFFAANEQYTRFLSLTEPLAWPIMAIFSVLFFRKIFTYLFFSMNEFNFFGAKGTLKPVEKMIAEEAKRLREQEKRTAENAQRDKEIKKLEVELANMGQSNTNAIEFAERIINLYEKQSKEVQKLKTEVDRPRMLQEALRRYAERLNGEVTTDDVKVDASISNKPNNPILN